MNDAAPDRWPRRLIPALFVLSGVFVVLHLVSYGLIAWLDARGLFVDVDSVRGALLLFSMDREAAIPAWFSSVLLALCAVVLVFISQDARARGDDRRRHWIALSVIFALASLDEGVGIHEFLNPLLGALVRPIGPLILGWWLPVGVALVLAVIVFLRFYATLDRWIRVRFAVCLAVFVSGAIVVEVIASLLPQDGSVALLLLSALEEALELTGVILFLATLRDVLRTPPTLRPAARAT